ncbi:hypothetical protein BKI52_19775 [marine bacterium AO1-C]|nr:hypothetical protein BKI52_19775 [marine bacterium AO1-C]
MKHIKPIKEVKHNDIVYHLFREEEEGLVCIKVDLGHLSAATHHPMLTQVGRGGIKPDGTFTGILTMKDKDGKYLHPNTRGSFVMKLLIDTELETGKTFKQSKSLWVHGAGVSDNLDKFNEGLAKGLNEKEAALQTWSGQWLKAHHGFNAVKDLHGTFQEEKNETGKSYKHYTEVVMFFYKDDQS